MTYDIGGRRLRTGEVAERAGVNIQTLRYYERRGLIAEPRPQPRRAPHLPARHRHPAQRHQVRAAARVHPRRGRRTARHRPPRHPTPDLRERAIAKIAEIDRKIADLTTIRTALTQVIDARCDSLTNCTCADCPLPYADLADGETP